MADTPRHTVAPEFIRTVRPADVHLGAARPMGCANTTEMSRMRCDNAELSLF